MEQENANVVDPAKESTIAHYPTWPRSKPGPEVTPPPSGTRPKPERPEQVVEFAYNPETGERMDAVLDNMEPGPEISSVTYGEGQEEDLKRSRERHHQKNQ